jgi:hypothetical protein
MSGGAIQISFASALLGVAVFVSGVFVLRNVTQKPAATVEAAPAQVPACTGLSSHSASAQPSSEAKRRPHSVILSWNAAIPASASPKDTIQGYHVYRSAAPGTYGEPNRISEFPVQGTRCRDATVEPQKTYYYAVKAVSKNGTRSNPSAEIRVVVPSP